jgi:uncharacterized protein YjbI with pentapeptide repeats
MEIIEIKNTGKQLDINSAMIMNSTITMSCLNGLLMDDVSAINFKITNANLSDLEIDGAQLGGAYIHNIGMPPKGSPFYDPNAKQRPLKFEDCELSGSEIKNCNLTDVSVTGCNLSGMTINCILVEELLTAYYASK